MALESVQPVPWVLGLSMRSPRNQWLFAVRPQQVVGVVEVVTALAEHGASEALGYDPRGLLHVLRERISHAG